MTKSQYKSNKVIIFDWDDTICPSSYVDQWRIQSFSDLAVHCQTLMNEVGKAAEKCLAAAAKHGEVIIITNSDDGWVKYSAEKYVPNLIPVLAKYRIVSARTRYEHFYPGQPLCWKAAAFAHEVNEQFGTEKGTVRGNRPVGNGSESVGSSFESMASTDISSDESPSPMSSAGGLNDGSESKTDQAPIGQCREVVSFGDSMEERTAVQIVSEQLSAIPKSVMFLTSPTPTQLLGQLSMLTSQMNYVCNHTDSLDLEMSPDQAQKCAEAFLGRKNRKALGVQRRAQVHDSSRIRYDRSDVNNMVLVSPTESSGKLEGDFSV
mmetsp:Transcript_3359/g.3766  ORF Transcript_3359/g.3766 Transcript_3359/m.3766 type:complete len:320 (-) Transcript_3359:40-999(-)|eukprot:CAMPEP_0198271806 /NCGR_PEP_ID=MMETSP1447-20131203/50664_1 /TAXON_ID=420782 /ORGANISM="Chaetoceros dichaeta, Strain CCMP1751" /LENGTH=319 /DNA_ID=CAMNT_0043964615 /DNA_START=46 /DNA_END=1005 /DNA_ORIENTATION=+